MARREAEAEADKSAANDRRKAGLAARLGQ